MSVTVSPTRYIPAARLVSPVLAVAGRTGKETSRAGENCPRIGDGRTGAGGTIERHRVQRQGDDLVGAGVGNWKGNGVDCYFDRIQTDMVAVIDHL